MDRGQPERPADGSDETIEPIDAVEPIDALAAAEDDDASDASDAPNERGSAVPPPEDVRDAPPAHWLAYIRARAPWLLVPGGKLAGSTGRATPDVVRHGPAAHAAPWPAADAVSRDRDAAEPPFAGDAPLRASAGDPADPTVAQEPAGGARGGLAPGPIGPLDVAPPPESRGSGALPRSGAPARREDVTDGGGRTSFPGSGDARPGIGSDASEHGEPRDPIDRPSEPSSSGDGAPARNVGWSDQPRRDQAFPPRPALLAHDRPHVPSPADLWSSIGDRAPGSGPAGSMRIEAPASRPATGYPQPAFPPLPGPTAADRMASRSRGPGRWRVRAAAPDLWTVARLDLPAWPDLPEPLPEDDADWRAIERRLERSARLDHEQRRR